MFLAPSDYILNYNALLPSTPLYAQASKETVRRYKYGKLVRWMSGHEASGGVLLPGEQLGER